MPDKSYRTYLADDTSKVERILRSIGTHFGYEGALAEEEIDDDSCKSKNILFSVQSLY